MAKWLVLAMVVLATVATAASAAVLHQRGDQRESAGTSSLARDRDHDGLPDRWERKHGLSARQPSARSDPDHDGLTNRREFKLRTHPRRKDTDRDGLRDGAEVRRYHTNPRKKDTDGDGYSDRTEIRKGTNPRKRKSHPPKPAPPPASFPNAANTGVPAGTRLSAYGGPDTISRAGTVIDGKTMGCIRVTAPGVVIRNSKIACAGGYAVYSGDGDYSGTPLRIEHSEIDCRHTSATALGEANITVRYVDIRGCENGADVNQRFTIEHSYIHDLYTSAEAHTDGIQLASGHFVNGNLVRASADVTIRHNTIYGMGSNGDFGTSAIISNRGGDHNVLIEGNLLGGGTYTLYCEQGAKGSNYRVINNHFTRRFRNSVGYYGASTDCSDETQSGNVLHETGRSLRLH